MKKVIVFILLMYVISMASMAQNKRIVVLETVDKEQSIPSAIVAMVHDDLINVISSRPGYEGCDGVSLADNKDMLDSLNLVEEDRIKLIGKNLEAGYLLVSEVVKYDETSVFVNAKILNTETAVTEGSENALMGMSEQNIRHGCESLVKRLLFHTNRFADLVKKPNNNIGEIISFSDGTKGIVFYLADNGRGLAVSLNEGEEVWDNSFNTKDIDTLYNVNNGEGSFKYGEGLRNTRLILSSLGDRARAAYWCSLQGEDWYLPSCGELIVLMRVVDDNPAFVEALRMAAGGEIDGWYWSSTEHNDDEVWNVNDSGRSSSEEKNERIKVRAIRMFTIE